MGRVWYYSRFQACLGTLECVPFGLGRTAVRGSKTVVVGSELMSAEVLLGAKSDFSLGYSLESLCRAWLLLVLPTDRTCSLVSPSLLPRLGQPLSFPGFSTCGSSFFRSAWGHLRHETPALPGTASAMDSY